MRRRGGGWENRRGVIRGEGMVVRVARMVVRGGDERSGERRGEGKWVWVWVLILKVRGKVLVWKYKLEVGNCGFGSEVRREVGKGDDCMM